ncbi:hypothetical protein [Lysinibacillus sp. NPDC047702]|uniref:hypothetical protein n=1 Tax=unclassified Lysinibacillus TaxID=2636778 RepID=UPI003D0469DD
MNIHSLIDEIDLLNSGVDYEKKVKDFLELLFSEIQKMSLDEFKKSVRHKLIYQRISKEFTIELGFKLIDKHQGCSRAIDKPLSDNS